MIGPVDAIEDTGDLGQALEVGRDVAADLQLEVALAVSGDDFGQGLRQAVADRLRRGQDRVDHADGVAGVDARRRPQAGQKTVHIETIEVRRQPCRLDAGEVAAHRLEEGDPLDPAKAVQDGAIQQRRAEAGDQRVQAVGGTPGDLLPVGAGVEAERGCGACVGIEFGCDRQGPAQLLEVVLVGERQVLVEPFRRQHLRRHAPALAPVPGPDPNPGEGLRCRRQRHHAEAEGHPEDDVALVEADLAEFDPRRLARRHFSDTPATIPATLPGPR